MPKRKNSRSIFKSSGLSKLLFVGFLVVFAIAGYFIYKSFAATPTPGLLEAESMKRYSGTKVIQDQAASNKRAVRILADAKKTSQRNLNGKISTGSAPAISFEVTARAFYCHKHWPSFVAYLSGDGITTQHIIVRKASYFGWHTYRLGGLNIPANKSYKVTLKYQTNVKYKGNKRCQSTLFFDKVEMKARTADITDVKLKKVNKTDAQITANINNYNTLTNYYIEYGTTTAYGSKTKDTKLQPKDTPQAVLAKVSDLQKGTTYHYRLCAVNGAGTICSADGTFKTAGNGSSSSSGSTSSGNNSSGSETHQCNNNAEHWNGSECVCNGGQINPDDCNVCPSPYVYVEPNCVIPES